MTSAGRFSVIIPTMQRFERFGEQLAAYAAEPLVGEIIVINNSDRPIEFDHPKLKVLEPGGNIYVNPAWNLGASTASQTLLCIANDDLIFDTSIFRKVRPLLSLPVGIVAPSEETFTDVEWGILAGRQYGGGRFTVRPVYRRTGGFGTLMFMRRSSYAPIPETMKIEFGDDYLFHQQSRHNLVFRGHMIQTPMSVTSADPVFRALCAEDTAAYRAIPKGVYERKFDWEPRLARTRVGLVHRVVRR